MRPYLVAMLASHVRSADQVEELALCLASALAQSAPPRLLLVSWSAASGALADAVEAALRVACGRAPRGALVSLRQAAARSQFEHYAACAAHVLPGVGVVVNGSPHSAHLGSTTVPLMGSTLPPKPLETFRTSRPSAARAWQATKDRWPDLHSITTVAPVLTVCVVAPRVALICCTVSLPAAWAGKQLASL